MIDREDLQAVEEINDQALDVAEAVAQNIYQVLEYQGIELGEDLSGQLESELHSEITEFLYKWTKKHMAVEPEENSRVANHIDVVELFGHSNSECHHDWEGFAGVKQPLELTAKVMNDWFYLFDPPLAQDISDMVLHYAYESLDQAGEISEYELQLFAQFYWHLMNCRYWLKSDVTWTYVDKKVGFILPEGMELVDEDDEDDRE